MKKNPYLSLLASLTLISAGALVDSSAAVIYQTVNQTGASDNWTNAIWGTPAAAPTSGNDYVSDGLTLRTSSAGSGTTFPGDSLTMKDSTLIFRRSSSANYILDNAKFNAVTNGAIGGTMFLAAGKVSEFSSNGRSPELSAEFSGSGTMTKSGVGTLTVTNAANSFSGAWIVTEETLVGAVAGSLDDTSSFTINSGATLDIQYTFENITTVVSIDSGGLFNLNNAGLSYTFGSFLLDGVALNPGTYTYADFTSSQQAYFIDGLDTITVIPEPSTWALLAGGLIAVSVFRRRRQLV